MSMAMPPIRRFQYCIIIAGASQPLGSAEPRTWRYPRWFHHEADAYKVAYESIGDTLNNFGLISPPLYGAPDDGLSLRLFAYARDARSSARAFCTRSFYSLAHYCYWLTLLFAFIAGIYFCQRLAFLDIMHAALPEVMKHFSVIGATTYSSMLRYHYLGRYASAVTLLRWRPRTPDHGIADDSEAMLIAPHVVSYRRRPRGGASGHSHWGFIFSHLHTLHRKLLHTVIIDARLGAFSFSFPSRHMLHNTAISPISRFTRL